MILELLRNRITNQGREVIVDQAPAHVEALDTLSAFRTEFYRCLTARRDALFEITDAVLCTDAPVRSLVDLTLVPEHRRRHGGMYDALNAGAINVRRLRRALVGLPLPRAADGRIVLAVDVSPWLRPDAPTSPDRLFCHVYGRGRNHDQLIPGWPYSIVAALETGRSSWTGVATEGRLGDLVLDVALDREGVSAELVQRALARADRLPEFPAPQRMLRSVA